VSVLEGGYVVGEGILSPFAQSVSAHVRALMNATKETLQVDQQKRRREDLPTDSPKRAKPSPSPGNSPARS